MGVYDGSVPQLHVIIQDDTRMDCDIAGHETEIARRAVYGA